MRAVTFFQKQRASAQEVEKARQAYLLASGVEVPKSPSRSKWFTPRYVTTIRGDRVIRRRVLPVFQKLRTACIVLVLGGVVAGGFLFDQKWKALESEKQRLAYSAALLRETQRLTHGIETERNFAKARRLVERHGSELFDSALREQDLQLLADRENLIDSLEATQESSKRARINSDDLRLQLAALGQKYQRVERLYQTNLAESKFHRDARKRTEGRVQSSEGRLAKMEDKVFLLLETLRGTLAEDAVPDMQGDLLSDITNLAKEFTIQEHEQIKQLARYAEHLDYAIDGMEKTIMQTGLSFSHLRKLGYKRVETEIALGEQNLGEEEDFGIGGPFEEGAVQEEEASGKGRDSARLRLAMLDKQFERFNTLRSVIVCLPLADPLKGGGRLVSGYGMRKDPFTKDPAMHYGVDLSAWYGTPIYATGPGRVKFTGYRMAYGRVVEIDHGCGILTRYAHLKEKNINTGDRVEIGTQIGVVGNSGRSTGPHLHYEVLLDRSPLDPASFMKGIDHVF